MMTRKDYVATADILNQFKWSIQDKEIFTDLVFEFSDMFAADNPRFDSDKFYDACMLEHELVLTN